MIEGIERRDGDVVAAPSLTIGVPGAAEAAVEAFDTSREVIG
jgi:hypothetical protein